MTEPDPPGADTPLDQVRALILADEALQMRLAQLYDPAAFAAAVIELAGAAGTILGEAAMQEALWSDPLGIGRFNAAPVTGQRAPSGDWLPVAMVPAGNELAVDWAHFAGAPLVEPFFQESLRRARSLPLNRLLRQRTPLASLVVESSAREGQRAPDGFIFHLSRCGSTLVAQMLAADPGNIVVSEAPPIDSVVQLAQSRPDVPAEERARLLRAMIGALGRGRTGEARHYVVKLDSWHAFALPLFRLAFPDTPWIFLYRDPVEILVSQMRERGMQTVPGVLQFDPYGIVGADSMPAEKYCARTLDLVSQAVLNNMKLGGGLLINYADLPGAVFGRILPHFGIESDAEAQAAMTAATGRHAKRPIESFAGDAAEKQRGATEAIRAAAALVDDSYRRLESLRTVPVG